MKEIEKDEKKIRKLSKSDKKKLSVRYMDGEDFKYDSRGVKVYKIK